jgi:excisionase family DNA binding protein
MEVNQDLSSVVAQILKKLDQLIKTMADSQEKPLTGVRALKTFDQIHQEQVLDKLDKINQSLSRPPVKQLTEEWFTTDETMKLLNLSRRTLQIYRDTGMISFSQIGPKIYFSRTDLDEHLNRHHVKAFNIKRG